MHSATFLLVHNKSLSIEQHSVFLLSSDISTCDDIYAAISRYLLHKENINFTAVPYYKVYVLEYSVTAAGIDAFSVCGSYMYDGDRVCPMMGVYVINPYYCC